jgi:hypothetical protein
MLYQLPTGKVISLTLDEYLNLSDNDIQWLISTNAGQYSQSPWHGSILREGKKAKPQLNKENLEYPMDDDELSPQIISIETLNIDQLDEFQSNDEYLEED